MRDISAVHIIILLVVILLLFGAKRLPDAARSVGKSMRIFKTEVKSLRDDDDTPEDDVKASTSGSTEAPKPLEGRAVDEARREQRRDEHHHTA